MEEMRCSGNDDGRWEADVESPALELRCNIRDVLQRCAVGFNAKRGVAG
jgi:hypothetical protein